MKQKLSFNSFEILDVSVVCGSNSLRLAVIYIPPPSNTNKLRNAIFLSEFATYVESMVASASRYIIVGDFNYHVDNRTDVNANQFLDLLESAGMKQHVQGKTHYQGHTSDQIVTRLVDNIVSSVKIDYSGYGLSDHARIVCDLKIQKHQIDNRTEIKYRNIKLIDLNVFFCFYG